MLIDLKVVFTVPSVHTRFYINTKDSIMSKCIINRETSNFVILLLKT